MYFGVSVSADYLAATVNTAAVEKHLMAPSSCPMIRVSRAFEKGETQGFMKVCVDGKTKQILGAAILGAGGDDVIHEATVAMAPSLDMTSP